MTRKLTQAQFTTVFRDQPSLHEALLKVGYLLPDLKDKIVTSKFLIDVSRGVIWLPKSDKKYF